ncbi:cytochrome P450, partial [Marasmius fiardii PR-910]
LDGIPTIGRNGIFSSYITAWEFYKDGRGLVEEGCRKYPGRVFKIPTLQGYHILINGPKLLEELRRANEDDLSIMAAMTDSLKSIYTISPTLNENPYHVDVVRTPLTRNIVARFDDIHDEIVAAFKDNIPNAEDDWVEIPVVKPIQNIIVRASNRFFVGLPVCRDQDYCDLNITFTVSVVVNATIISLFPKYLHPIVGRIFTVGKSSLRRALRHLRPVIEERLRKDREYGKDWPGGDRPNDYISWFIDTSEEIGEDWQRGSVEDLALRVLGINFAAVHTTSMAFTHALYHLAANPHLAQPLRDEVEAIIAKEGWTKIAMVQLRLMDSFLKESQRTAGVGPVSVVRITQKDYRFSDGTLVPAGYRVGVPAYWLHQQENVYPDPGTFNPTRFSDLRSQEGESVRHQLVTPTPDWVIFGSGKHACPGRFFAVNEIKAMLAHVLLNYDVKFRDEAPGYPTPLVYGGNMLPNQSAKVMFRKRKV